MSYKIEYIKDILGSNYIGINVDVNIIKPFLNDLRVHLGDDLYNKYSEAQTKRDKGLYHITLINVMEFNKLSTKMGVSDVVKYIEPLFDYDIDDLKLMGVGEASKNERTAYFVVCKSDKLNHIREHFGLEEKDLHITIGFYPNDVFGVPKNTIMKLNSSFKKLLRETYYNNKNFDFIKKFSNFNLPIRDEIYMISLGDEFAKFKCGDKYMDIAEIDGKLRIVAEYEALDLPILSTTEINKQLNINNLWN